MTAQIIKFRPRSTPVPPVIEGEILDPPCDAPKRRKQRAKMRVEQVEVTCTCVPRKQHHDLCGLPGVLTIDWKGETPWTATFDPHDEAIPNIVAPIENCKRNDDTIEVACDEGTWTFVLLADDDGEAP